MARIGTDDVHHSSAADDLAMFTDALNAGTNFHGGITAGTWNFDKRLNIALAPGCGQAPSANRVLDIGERGRKTAGGFVAERWQSQPAFSAAEM